MATGTTSVWRRQVTSTKVGAAAASRAIVMIPEGVTDLTVFVVSNNAAGAKVWESPSSAQKIQTAVGDTWLSLNASTDSVGTTMVAYALGAHTPVALRVEALVNNKTATLIVTGRRVY